MKRLIAIILIVSVSLAFISASASAYDDAMNAAKKLDALGLFHGVGKNQDGTTDYALDRPPTRAEAAVILVRLAGKEAEALSGSCRMPFTDVPDWAKPYVGYAYENGLIFGVGVNTFSSGRAVTAFEFLTIILRVLGYNPGIDFGWDKVWSKSEEIGLTGGRYTSEPKNFLRGDVAVISLNTLKVKFKDSDKTLGSALIEAGIITETAVSAAGVAVIDAWLPPLAESAPVKTREIINTPGDSQYESEVFILINSIRMQNGLRPLVWNAGLAAVARTHSIDMITRDFFDHISPDGKKPPDRMRAAGLSFIYSGEILARGYKTPEEVVEAWMDSPAHRDAMLSTKPTEMGVGVQDRYWTVNFLA